MPGVISPTTLGASASDRHYISMIGEGVAVNAVPEGFNDEFLDWFRERTEAVWATYQADTFEDYVRAGVGGEDFQRGTRWLDGLSDIQIDEIERRWSVRFPPDYRRFLRRLHSVDRPRTGAYYADDSRMAPRERPSFYNWLTDTDALHDRFEWPIEGIQFDVEYGDLWPESWGAKPTTLEERQARVREVVGAAPKLIPVFSHRYLLAEPCQAGNPVLSVHQSDIIVYGADLRDYFLAEFSGLLGLDRRLVGEEVQAGIQAGWERFAAIPFWGAFLTGDV